MLSFEWKRFLEAFSRDLLADDTIRSAVPKNVAESGWLGFDPAPREEISKLENRLGVELPLSYKAFLSISNGWRMTGPFINEVYGTGSVRHFKNENQNWVDVYVNPLAGADATATEILGTFYGDMQMPDVPDDEYFAYGEEQAPARNSYLQNAIQVSAVGDAAVYLLCPDGVSPEGEYEAWFFADWIPGAKRFASFEDLMQDARNSFHDLRSNAQ